MADMRIDCYKNLQKNCISVRSRETEDYGRVVAHRDKVYVVDAEFVVQPAGQRRVRNTGTKNVHAFVRGLWNDSEKLIDGEPVTYNPYKYDAFVHTGSETAVTGADVVMVSADGMRAKGLY